MTGRRRRRRAIGWSAVSSPLAVQEQQKLAKVKEKETVLSPPQLADTVLVTLDTGVNHRKPQTGRLSLLSPSSFSPKEDSNSLSFFRWLKEMPCNSKSYQHCSALKDLLVLLLQLIAASRHTGKWNENEQIKKKEKEEKTVAGHNPSNTFSGIGN